MNSTICDVADFTIVPPRIQCVGELICPALDWLIGPSMVRCFTSDPTGAWTERTWHCLTNVAYVMDTKLMCTSDLCHTLDECFVQYSLVSTIYLIIGFITVICGFAFAALVAYYVMFLLPFNTKLPYIETGRNGRIEVRFLNIHDLRGKPKRHHAV